MQSSTPVLRDYQAPMVDRVRAEFRAGRRRVLMVLPTGGGKTICFCYIAANAAARGNRVWILAHRVELVDQISESLRMFNVTHGFIAADYPPRRTSAVHIASVQTLIRRIDREPAPDLIIVDEAHHATANNTLGRILAARPRARVLGVTATPWRLSGEGLGEVFESMVVGPSVGELIEAGALCAPEVYAPPAVDTSALHSRAGDFIASEVSSLMDSPKITGDAVDHYRRLARGLPFIAFTASVEHARHVGDDFTKAGFPCLHVDGGMDRMQRRRIVNDYKEGRLLGLASCELVSEGFDVPGIHCGISLRPTQSLTLWLQQVGRCLRTAPGKERAIILDHAGNTLRHGLPTELREWTLEGREQAAGKRAASDSISVRVCPSCFAAGKAGRPTCPSCGAPYPVAARKVEEVDGTLEKVEATHVRKPASPLMREQGRTRDLQSLTELGRMRGYKDPAAWAAHIINAREKKRRVGA